MADYLPLYKPGQSITLSARTFQAGSTVTFTANVAALEGVLPVQLAPEDITARLGVSWIPPADVESFCADVLGARVEVEYLSALGRWEVMTPAGRRGVAFSAEWGTPRADAATLLRASLNQQLHTVYDETDDGRRVRNDAETIAAREKLSKERRKEFVARVATGDWDGVIFSQSSFVRLPLAFFQVGQSRLELAELFARACEHGGLDVELLAAHEIELGQHRRHPCLEIAFEVLRRGLAQHLAEPGQQVVEERGIGKFRVHRPPPCDARV